MKEVKMIKPSVGRVVWYFQNERHKQPFAAIIVYVHSDTLVNLAVFDDEGRTSRQTSVQLVQSDVDIEHPAFPFCRWMPYQIGQAAKTEELQKQIEKK